MVALLCMKRTLLISTVGSLIGTLIFWMAGFIWFWFSSGEWLESVLWIGRESSWQWAIILFTFPVPVWVILVTILIVSFMLLLTRKGMTARINVSDERNRLKQDYTEDTIDGVNWRWEWSIWNRLASINGLTPYCHNCDAVLMAILSGDRFGDARTNLICEHCPSPKIPESPTEADEEESSKVVPHHQRQHLALREGKGRIVASREGHPEDVHKATEREILRRNRTKEYPNT